MKQFSIRSLLILLTLVCIYVALARSYGYGRAIVCMLVVFQALTSILFFVAARYARAEEHFRNQIAATLLGIMILSGAFFSAAIVFQQPVVVPSAFELDSLPEVSRVSDQ